MTDNRRLKRRIRERMAQTGENYTRALRAVLLEIEIEQADAQAKDDE